MTIAIRPLSRRTYLDSPSEEETQVLAQPRSSKYLKTDQDPVFTPELHASFDLDPSNFRIFRSQSNSHASPIWLPSNSQRFYDSIDSFRLLNLLSWEGPTVFPIKIVKKQEKRQQEKVTKLN